MPTAQSQSGTRRQRGSPNHERLRFPSRCVSALHLLLLGWNFAQRMMALDAYARIV